MPKGTGVHENGILCILHGDLSCFWAQMAGLEGGVATQIAPKADLLETYRNRAVSDSRASRWVGCAGACARLPVRSGAVGRMRGVAGAKTQQPKKELLCSDRHFVAWTGIAVPFGGRDPRSGKE